MQRSRATTLALVCFIMAAGCMDGDLTTVTGPAGDALYAIGEGASDGLDGHYIVVLSTQPAAQNMAAEAALDALTAALGRQPGARVGHEYRRVLTGFAAELTDQQVAALRQDPRVLAIEQDRYVYPAAEGTVQEYPTWGLDRIDQRETLLDRVYVYAATGHGVTAYIMDSGIRYDHDEFGGRASLGYDFVVEDDPDNTDPTQAPGEDCRGHGTHVAGTVGGGTFGVAKDVDLVSVRVFGCSGGSPYSRVLAAVEWITENTRHPAVVNMSLGGYFNELIQVVDAAIENSIEAGVHYVAAAGNANEDACLWSPARVPGVLTAGAIAIGDGRATFSNYGDCVDLYAPGVSIISAWHTDVWREDGSYTRSASGTSMAAPHVAGVVALLLEADPAASPADVHAAILANTTAGAVSGVPSGANLLLHSLWQSPGAPTLPTLNLLATGLKVRGKHTIDLVWDFVRDAQVSVYRDGSLIGILWNVSSYRDDTGIGGNEGIYVHHVCESTPFYRELCSEEVTTIFGDGGGDGDGTEPPAGDELVASFAYACGNSPTCQFTDTSTGSVATWTWGFADGSAGSEAQHPAHEFATPGTYTVTLTVTDRASLTAATQATVTCDLHRRHGLRCS
jgi:subtilisin family serine protease